MENDEENTYISYNRFSLPKKQVIQHKHTDSDSNSIASYNSLKASKNVITPPNSFSSTSSFKQNYGSPKREDSITNNKNINLEEYQHILTQQQQQQQANQKGKHFKQNSDLKFQIKKHQEEIQRSLQYYQYQQQKGQHNKREKDTYINEQGIKIEKTNISSPKTKPSELSSSINNYNSINKMNSPKPLKNPNNTSRMPDITSAMASVSINDRIPNNSNNNNNNSDYGMYPNTHTPPPALQQQPTPPPQRQPLPQQQQQQPQLPIPNNTNSNNSQRRPPPPENRKINKKKSTPHSLNDDYSYSNNLIDSYASSTNEESDNESRKGLILDKDKNKKKSKNNEKLGNLKKKGSNNYYGDEPNMDVSVSEIINFGLKAMIKSKVPLCYFLYTLIEDYCCENLFFYLEIEQYKNFLFENSAAQLKAAQYIYITYLDSSSKIEVNIDEKIRREILNQLNNKYCNLLTIFDRAMESVFSLMESSYAKFNRSNIKKQMIDELDNTNIYNDEHKINAIRLLTSYLDKRRRELEHDAELLNLESSSSNSSSPRMNNANNEKRTPPSSAVKYTTPEQLLHKTNVQRHLMICALTHEFIRAFLELDFDDESVPGEVCVFRPPVQYIQNINDDPYRIFSSSPSNKRFMQEIQVSVHVDNQGQQFQVVTTPPIPLASYRLDNYSTEPSDKKNGVFKKFMKSVKLL